MLTNDKQTCILKLCQKKEKNKKVSSCTITDHNLIEIARMLNFQFNFYSSKELLTVLNILGKTMATSVALGDDLELPLSLGLLVPVTVNQELGDTTNGEKNTLKVNLLESKKLWKENPELTNKKFIYYINNDLTYNKISYNRLGYVSNLPLYKLRKSAEFKSIVSEEAKKGRKYKFKKAKE